VGWQDTSMIETKDVVDVFFFLGENNENQSETD
jgi:hypothetical protein